MKLVNLHGLHQRVLLVTLHGSPWRVRARLPARHPVLASSATYTALAPLLLHCLNHPAWLRRYESHVSGETFIMKTKGQDTTSGYRTLREAIQRTSPTLVSLSQLTEPNRVYGLEEKRQGKRKIEWAQAIYPLRARLQELKSHLLSEKWDEVLEDKLFQLKSGEQAFMATRPRLI